MNLLKVTEAKHIPGTHEMHAYHDSWHDEIPTTREVTEADRDAIVAELREAYRTESSWGKLRWRGSPARLIEIRGTSVIVEDSCSLCD